MNEIYWYEVELQSNSSFCDINWMDLEDFTLLSSFAKNYKYKTALVYLALAHVEFMAYLMDCPSCAPQEKYFEEFQKFLQNKEKEHSI